MVHRSMISAAAMSHGYDTRDRPAGGSKMHVRMETDGQNSRFFVHVKGRMARQRMLLGYRQVNA